MKKFFRFLSFFLVIALAAAVFIFGWAQLSVPPGSYGVLRSKTHGVDPELVREGKFRWIWYKLIPTNVTLSVFSLAPLTKSIDVQGELPSGSLYASFLGLDMDFSYELLGSLYFSVKPDSLAALVRDHGIKDQAEFDAYSDRLADKITLLAVEKLRSYGEDEKKLEGLLTQGGGELGSDLEKAFPDIENLSLTIRQVRFPDYALYASTRSLYESYVEKQRESLSGAVNEAALRHLDSQSRYDELTKYGELLTKYPVLLQYLALEKGIDTRARPETGQ